MQAKEKELDEDRIKQLNKQIRSGNLAVKWSMGGALVFLLGFCYVPLAIEHEKKWLIILIHFAIPLVDMLVVYLTFPLMKPYLLKGIKQKLKNPELDDRYNKPLMAYNLIYICNVMIFGLALPVVVVVVLLKANTSLLFIWAFLSANALYATIEYRAKKALEYLLTANQFKN